MIRNSSTARAGEILSLLDQGLSVFPVTRGEKVPLVQWSEYQHRLPAPELVKAWLRAWPECSWAVATGPVSRLTVVDVDPRHGGDQTMAQYPSLPATVLTGSGGTHVYFRVNEHFASRTNTLPGVDVKGVGGLVVVPPSVHASGQPYRWVGSPLTDVPEWLRPVLRPAEGIGLHQATAQPGACS